MNRLLLSYEVLRKIKGIGCGFFSFTFFSFTAELNFPGEDIYSFTRGGT